MRLTLLRSIQAERAAYLPASGSQGIRSRVTLRWRSYIEAALLCACLPKKDKHATGLRPAGAQSCIVSLDLPKPGNLPAGL